MPFVELDGVTKEFRIHKRQKGFLNSVKSLFNRQYDIKRAVDGISFQIARGELVGYIGPNGAGKSTTVKLLSGILVPTKGSIAVDGRVPYLNRRENAMHIGVVFGQRSQLYWDLPTGETFDVYQKMYRIEEQRFARNVQFYTELLDMGEFLHVPARQLSLGQKMRANLAIALLHDPDIIYLDEPTIGLDVVAKSAVRDFIREVNREKKTTVILTTHDMRDVERICDRLIMIDRGRILYDGTLQEFKNKYGTGHTIVVDLADGETAIQDHRLKVVKKEGPRRFIMFDKQEINVAEAITVLTHSHAITDLSVRETDIEEVVRQVYESLRHSQVARS